MSRQTAAPAPDGYIWRNGMRVKVQPPEAVKAKPKQQRPVLTLPSVPKPLEAPAAPPPPPPPAAAQHQAPKLHRWPRPIANQAPLPVPRFWFVWCPSEGAPRRRHETREGAIGEARRLAELHAGHAFHVYGAELVPDPRNTDATEGAGNG